MRKILFGVMIVVGMTGVAQASSYVWKDPAQGFTFSFPDSWTVQTQDVPTDRIRIAGPIGEDLATCRVKAEKDGRLKIYPKRLMTEAVAETLNHDFWDHEVNEHGQASVTDYYAPAGLGSQGDATAIKYSYMQDTGSGKTQMYGQMIGSIYGDTRYVVSCSSKFEVYAQYAPLFSSIIGSVELASQYHPFAVGYYRDFLADPQLILPRTKPGTIHARSRWFSFFD